MVSGNVPLQRGLSDCFTAIRKKVVRITERRTGSEYAAGIVFSDSGKGRRSMGANRRAVSWEHEHASIPKNSGRQPYPGHRGLSVRARRGPLWTPETLSGDRLPQSHHRLSRRGLSLPDLPAGGVALGRPQALAHRFVPPWARRARRGGHVADADRAAGGAARPPRALAVHRGDAAMPPAPLLDRAGDDGHGHGHARSGDRRIPRRPNAHVSHRALTGRLWRMGTGPRLSQALGGDCHCRRRHLLELRTRSLA